MAHENQNIIPYTPNLSLEFLKKCSLSEQLKNDLMIFFETLNFTEQDLQTFEQFVSCKRSLTDDSSSSIPKRQKTEIFFASPEEESDSDDDKPLFEKINQKECDKTLTFLREVVKTLTEKKAPEASQTSETQKALKMFKTRKDGDDKFFESQNGWNPDNDDLFFDSTPVAESLKEILKLEFNSAILLQFVFLIYYQKSNEDKQQQASQETTMENITEFTEHLKKLPQINLYTYKKSSDKVSEYDEEFDINEKNVHLIFFKKRWTTNRTLFYMENKNSLRKINYLDKQTIENDISNSEIYNNETIEKKVKNVFVNLDESTDEKGKALQIILGKFLEYGILEPYKLNVQDKQSFAIFLELFEKLDDSSMKLEKQSKCVWLLCTIITGSILKVFDDNVILHKSILTWIIIILKNYQFIKYQPELKKEWKQNINQNLLHLCQLRKDLYQLDFFTQNVNTVFSNLNYLSMRWIKEYNDKYKSIGNKDIPELFLQRDTMDNNFKDLKNLLSDENGLNEWINLYRNLIIKDSNLLYTKNNYSNSNQSLFCDQPITKYENDDFFSKCISKANEKILVPDKKSCFNSTVSDPNFLQSLFTETLIFTNGDFTKFKSKLQNFFLYQNMLTIDEYQIHLHNQLQYLYKKCDFQIDDDTKTHGILRTMKNKIKRFLDSRINFLNNDKELFEKIQKHIAENNKNNMRFDAISCFTNFQNANRQLKNIIVQKLIFFDQTDTFDERLIEIYLQKFPYKQTKVKFSQFQGIEMFIATRCLQICRKQLSLTCNNVIKLP